jgi:hypothetical protein
MSESRNITIADKGKPLHLEYQGLLAYHGGGAVLGATIGFRVLQGVAKILSANELWDREKLQVVSEHPGPGVRDAMEYVTRCVIRNRYKVISDQTTCNSKVKFQWRVDDGRQTVRAKLREGILPAHFFQLLDRIGNDKGGPGDREELEGLKQTLSLMVMEKSLDTLFELNRFETQNHA